MIVANQHASQMGTPDRRPESRQLLLVVRIAGRAHGLPGKWVERILHMAEPAPLPTAPPGVIGLLNLGDSLLPVVDPRPRLGIPTPLLHPDQYLVVLAAPRRYLLWVDRVEQLVEACTHTVDGPDSLAMGVVRLDDEVVPVLSPAAFDPGPVVAAEAWR